jgi:hypothetical protein
LADAVELLRLQRLAGNAAVARAVAQRSLTVMRHSEDEEAKGEHKDDEGTEIEDEESIQRRVDPSAALIQRIKDIGAIKTTFDAKVLSDGKTAAANFLKKKYSLDTKTYTLSVAPLPKASTHASTGGGWNTAGTAFTPIRVRVNEPYLDQQSQTADGFNKLVHTLTHEYQHVKQRSQKGWTTTGDASAKGEREFLAYSFEILDAGKKKGIQILPQREMASTITKALKYYATMSPALQTKHKSRHDKLISARVLNGW